MCGLKTREPVKPDEKVCGWNKTTQASEKMGKNSISILGEKCRGEIA